LGTLLRARFGVLHVPERVLPPPLQFGGDQTIGRINLLKLALRQRRLIAQALELLSVRTLGRGLRVLLAARARAYASSSTGDSAAKKASTTFASTGSAGMYWQTGPRIAGGDGCRDSASHSCTGRPACAHIGRNTPSHARALRRAVECRGLIAIVLA